MYHTIFFYIPTIYTMYAACVHCALSEFKIAVLKL